MKCLMHLIIYSQNAPQSYLTLSIKLGTLQVKGLSFVS